MKFILFLGNRKKSRTFINYCDQNNYPYLIVEKHPNRYQEDQLLIDKTIFLKEKFELDGIIECLYKKQFIPNFIYCFIDDYIEIEYELTKHYKCINNFDYDALQFFKYKSVQNKICKELNIPVIRTIR